MSATTQKPVILLAFANARDDSVGYLRNLPDEARRLRAVLGSAEQAGLCEVEVQSNCTAADIIQVFQNPKYRNRIAIFHYGGHANGYQLLLESAAGQSAAADAGGFAAFLAQQRGLQLVFLNGCSTEQQTQGLLDANVSAVISTSRSIDDKVATEFAVHFYQGLAGGASVRTAYQEAAAAVRTTQGGNTRALYFGSQEGGTGSLEADRWPWNLYFREGSESTERWSLPEAADDPLFGLPQLPEQDLPESPYRHLNWFTRKDAEIFFGRGHQIRELYDRLTTPATAPIILFYGQSGVGKSSILDAGLIPRLEPSYEVRYLRRGGGGLLDTLRLAFLPEAGEVPIETAWQAKEEQLAKPLIVFLDQVEELYTRPFAELPNELKEFLKAVKAIFGDPSRRPRGKLVLGFRKEWLAELEAQLAAHELPRTKVFLEPLNRRGIIEVVRGPARSARLREHYGLIIDDGLAEIIADNLLEDRGSAITPTLQVLLTKLWTEAEKKNDARPHFTQELYQSLQREGILLRDFFNQQIAAIREQDPDVVESGLLLDIVARHTTPLGTAGQCSVEQLERDYAHAKLSKILPQCQNLHLLTETTTPQQESTKTTRLAHDTLAPIVREQFDKSDKPGQRARRILDNRSVDWKDDKEGAPLDEADLMLVEQGMAGTRVWNSTEQRLVAASRKLLSRLRRTQLWLKVLGALAVIVIAALAVFASIKYYQADVARAEAEVAKGEAEKSLTTAIASVRDLLDLYLELPQEAGNIAAATSAGEARTAYERIEKAGRAVSLRVTSPEIADALKGLDSALKTWETSGESDQSSAAERCRQAVLTLVSTTGHAWESRSSTDDSRRKMELEQVAPKLCHRASTVTRSIAKAADKTAMLTFRAEFERLYWAELYWLELEEKRESPDGKSPLEHAMFNFREFGLNEWSLAETPNPKLDEMAKEVNSRCEALLALVKSR